MAAGTRKGANFCPLDWFKIYFVNSEFPEIPRVRDVTSFFTNVDNEPILNTIQSVVSEAGLENMLDLLVEVNEMSAKVRIITGRNMMMISAKGKTTVKNLGITVTRFVLLFPFPFAHGISTSKAVTNTPTTGRKSRGLHAMLPKPRF